MKSKRKNDIVFLAALLALMLMALPPANRVNAAAVGGVDLGNLTDYLFFFADGSTDANWQGATKGFVGDVAVNGIAAAERTSGGVPYAGTIYTNDSTLSAWQGIVDQNVGQASGSTGETARLAGLATDLTNAFAQINALPATGGVYQQLTSAPIASQATGGASYEWMDESAVAGKAYFYRLEALPSGQMIGPVSARLWGMQLFVPFMRTDG